MRMTFGGFDQLGQDMCLQRAQRLLVGPMASSATSLDHTASACANRRAGAALPLERSRALARGRDQPPAFAGAQGVPSIYVNDRLPDMPWRSDFEDVVAYCARAGGPAYQCRPCWRQVNKTIRCSSRATRRFLRHAAAIAAHANGFSLAHHLRYRLGPVRAVHGDVMDGASAGGEDRAGFAAGPDSQTAWVECLHCSRFCFRHLVCPVSTC
jgi:hypothetical protein